VRPVPYPAHLNGAGGKYFDDGYIEQDGEQGPSFFENLMSGGKLQREYDERMRQGKKK